MHISRRHLLRSAGAASALWLSPVRALALEDDPEPTGKRPTLVLVFLRGGVDGLNLVVPHGDPAYAASRPQIAIRPPGREDGAVDLDGFFGLHPAARALAPLFESGVAACLHAVGHPANTRSHFEEQDRWETAADAPGPSSAGWLGRHLETSRGRGPIRAIALGDTLPRSLRGDVTALALRGLEDLSFPGDGVADTLAALSRAYGGDGEGGDLVRRGGRASLEALRRLQDVARRVPHSGVEYPNTNLGRRARELARLVRADVGLEVVELDRGGWDTHQNQGGAAGSFANNVRDVADSLAALLRDLEDRLDDVLVLTVSEFGRTAAQNGTGGTDHGWGTCVLALGGPVLRRRSGRDGPVLGRWPGLGEDELHQGRDLALTTDFRDVYAEALAFLGNERAGEVLAGHAPAPVGLV